MQDKFDTERLCLSVLTENDYSFIRELVNTEGWLRFIGDRKIYSDEDAIAYIKKINGMPNFTYWVVRLKATDEPIGIVTFLKRSYLEHFDIGFAFLPGYNRKGYAFEAAEKILTAVKESNEHTKVLATTLPDNIRSINLLTRLGFSFERELEEGKDKLRIYSYDI